MNRCLLRSSKKPLPLLMIASLSKKAMKVDKLQASLNKNQFNLKILARSIMNKLVLFKNKLQEIWINWVTREFVQHQQRMKLKENNLKNHKFQLNSTKMNKFKRKRIQKKNNQNKMFPQLENMIQYQKIYHRWISNNKINNLSQAANNIIDLRIINVRKNKHNYNRTFNKRKFTHKLKMPTLMLKEVIKTRKTSLNNNNLYINRDMEEEDRFKVIIGEEEAIQVLVEELVFIQEIWTRDSLFTLMRKMIHPKVRSICLLLRVEESLLIQWKLRSYTMFLLLEGEEEGRAIIIEI